MKNTLIIALLALAAIAALGLSAYAGVFDGLRRAAEKNDAGQTDRYPKTADRDASGATSSPIGGHDQSPSVPPQGTAISVRGTMVCLPHKDTSGPQTMECAFGIKADDGRYYGLSDTDPNYGNVAGVPMDVRVKVDGAFVARADSNYQDIGVIYVTAITRL